MKKLLSCILAFAMMFSSVSFAFAEKEVTIDSEVPVFKGLKNGDTYVGSKEIEMADLSIVDAVVLKKSEADNYSFTAHEYEHTFVGYKEYLEPFRNVKCINYVKLCKINEVGEYRLFAIDEHQHATIIDFVIVANLYPTATPGHNGGGGGGGGGGGAPVASVKQPYANGDSKNTGGTLTEGEKITLETDTDGAKIYYTLDGSTPTSKSNLYTAGTELELEDGQVLKAIAIKGKKSSDVSEWECVAEAEPEPTDDPNTGVDPGIGGGGSGGGSIVGDVLDAENHIVYMTGYPDKTFGPNRNMTRAEVATMFARLVKDKMQDNTKYPSTFSDVAEDAWYADYIGYMQKYEVIEGYDDGTFGPEKTITRAEFVTIASRFAEMSEEYDCDFVDIEEDYWAYAYIAFASHHGWIGGYEDNTFRAGRTITRAEVVTIVNNMLVRAADSDYVEANKADLIMFSDVSESHWAYLDIVESTNEHDYQISNNKEIWQ